MPTVPTTAVDLLSPEQPYGRPAIPARKPLASLVIAGAPTAFARPAVRQPAPTVTPGQLWLVESSPSAALLRSFEHDALNAANVVIYDRALTARIAAALPLGTYAEPAKTTDQVLDGAEFERVLRLALDGWSVMRLFSGDGTASQRSDRLRRIAARLRGAGIGAGLPVRLVTETASGHATTDSTLGDLAGVLDGGHFERRVTAIFATRRSGGAGPLYAVVDNGLAG